MDDVYKLLALAFAAFVLVIAGIVGVRVYQDWYMVWYILGVVGACAVIVSSGIAVAAAYDRRSNFLRRQQEFENERKAFQVTTTAILRALVAAGASSCQGTQGQQAWTDTVSYLLRDVAAGEMVDDVPVGGPSLPGAANLHQPQNGHIGGT